MERGFSLLELIIAFVLLVLLFLSIGTLIPYSQMSMRTTASKDVATTMAESMIESIRVLDWDDVDKSGKTYSGLTASPFSPFHGKFPPPPFPQKKVRNDSPSLQGDITIEGEKNYFFIVRSFYDPGTSQSNIIKVVVGVYWDVTNNREDTGKKVILTSKLFHKE